MWLDNQGNKIADTAAKAVCTLPARISLSLLKNGCPRDPLVSQDWQVSWTAQLTLTNSTLVKQLCSLGLAPQSSQHHEIPLTHLRIGHTRLTPEHLMSSPTGPQPVCWTFDALLNIKHILVACQTFDPSWCFFPIPTLSRILTSIKTFLPVLNPSGQHCEFQW